MDHATHYRMFGRHNAWANGRLYTAAAGLGAEQCRAERVAFFKSVNGTFAELRAARKAEDSRIVSCLDGLTDDGLAGTIRYRRVSSPGQFEQQLAPAQTHGFNHQTHHWGQVHSLLTGLTGKAPELDLLSFQRLAAAPA